MTFDSDAVRALLTVAPTNDVFDRWVFQLNDDLSAAGVAGIVEAPQFGSNRSVNAVIAACFSYHFSLAGVPRPSWLDDPLLIAEEPFFLDVSAGLQSLVASLTPDSVSRHNVFIDEPSLVSV